MSKFIRGLNRYHVYDNCDSTYNDLDGIVINCPNVLIKDCRFNYNGSAPLGDALGAGGIYNDRIQSNIKIINTSCNGNTEYGINAIFNNVTIENVTCRLNALSGICIRSGSVRIRISNSDCSQNGNNPTTTNPEVWGKAGIQFDGVSFMTIIGCSCYDDRSISTQTFGIQSMAVIGSELVAIVANNLKYNKTDDSNLGPGYTQSQHKVNNLVYNNNI